MTYRAQKNAEALAVARKEIALEVNAGKTKYMVISWNHNTGRSHNVQIDISSFEKVEKFKYLGTNIIETNRSFSSC